MARYANDPATRQSNDRSQEAAPDHQIRARNAYSAKSAGIGSRRARFPRLPAPAPNLDLDALRPLDGEPQRCPGLRVDPAIELDVTFLTISHSGAAAGHHSSETGQAQQPLRIGASARCDHVGDHQIH